MSGNMTVSESFDFDMIFPDAMLKWSMADCTCDAYQEFHHGMNMVSLQKTLQSAIFPAEIFLRDCFL